nr:hypothetical protein HmN_000698100 [Hymenolepis microstoma]
MKLANKVEGLHKEEDSVDTQLYLEIEVVKFSHLGAYFGLGKYDEACIGQKAENRVSIAGRIDKTVILSIS